MSRVADANSFVVRGPGCAQSDTLQYLHSERLQLVQVLSRWRTQVRCDRDLRVGKVYGNPALPVHRFLSLLFSRPKSSRRPALVGRHFRCHVELPRDAVGVFDRHVSPLQNRVDSQRRRRHSACIQSGCNSFEFRLAAAPKRDVIIDATTICAARGRLSGVAAGVARR
jgi:hypothetical protein